MFKQAFRHSDIGTNYRVALLSELFDGRLTNTTCSACDHRNTIVLSRHRMPPVIVFASLYVKGRVPLMPAV